MSRSGKLWACGIGLVVSLIVAILIGAEMLRPIASQGYGASGVPPVTAAGWMQLAVAVLGVFGFSGTGLVQGAFAWMEAKGVDTIKKFAPSVTDKTAGQIVDVVKIATMTQLVKQSTGDAQTQWIKAARLEMDEMRDSLFPLPAGQ